MNLICVLLEMHSTCTLLLMVVEFGFFAILSLHALHNQFLDLF